MRSELAPHTANRIVGACSVVIFTTPWIGAYLIYGIQGVGWLAVAGMIAVAGCFIVVAGRSL